MRKTQIATYIVADGGRGRIFTREGRGPLRLVDSLESANEHRKDHDLGSERPGRTRESVGGTRHAVEEPDHHEIAKQRFAAALAEAISDADRQTSCDHLILVAPPPFLGMLKEALPKDLHARLGEPVAKDLTHFGVADLLAHLERDGVA